MKKQFFILFIIIFAFLFIGLVQFAQADTISDNFNDGNADGWLSITGYPPGTSGNWRVSNGAVIEDMGRDHFIFVLKDYSISNNQSVEAKVLWHDNGYAGITIWAQDENHSVQVYYRYQGGVAVLEKVYSNEVMTIYPNDKWQRIWRTLKVEANSLTGEIVVYLDGEYLFTHRVGANTARTGLSGFNSGNAGGSFDDFKITFNNEAKATVTCGQAVSYGGQSYNTVQIGSQCWFKENLNAGSMIGNTEIPDSTAPTLNNPSTVSKWCYNDSSTYCTDEGGLYTWAETNALPNSCNSTYCSVSTPNQGICPAGWHIPSDAEFYTLENYLTTPGQTCGATRNGWDCSDAGNKLRLGGSSDFDAIGAGNHETNGAPSFFDKREPSAHFWLSSPTAASYADDTYAWLRALYILASGSEYDVVGRGSYIKAFGFSVRCLADSSTATPSCATWTYSDWSTCSASGQQTRTVISSSPSGCTGGNPIITQSCTYTAPTCTSWIYSGWGTCSSGGQQTRTVTSSSPSGCAGGSPVLSQSCTYIPPTCTSWTYSSWGACSSSGQQTRTVASSSPSNCTGGSPTLNQSCTPSTTTCTSWIYSNWGACSSSGQQARTIASSSPSNCTGGSPVTTQSCTYTPVCTASDWSCSDWGTCSVGGNQTRVCAKTSNCQGGVSSPATKQTCTPPCTESKWSCSGWGNCQEDGTQTRECAKTFDCSTDSSQPPSTLKYCSYTPKCTADTWNCDNWSTCSPQGVQGRSCRKTFDCPNIETKAPETSQYCEAPNRPNDNNQGDGEITNEDNIVKSTAILVCPINQWVGKGGTGTVIDSQGSILTNKHVIDGTLKFCRVGFTKNYGDAPIFSEYADVAKVSNDEDMAILKIRNYNNKKFNYIDIMKGDVNNIKVRKKIYVYGYPKIGGWTLLSTDGIISGFQGNTIITNATIAGGNSGGGAYLLDGTYIGIPSATNQDFNTETRQTTSNSLAFIVSVRKIRDWVKYNYNSKSFSYAFNYSINKSVKVESINFDSLKIYNIASAKISIYSDRTKKTILPNISGIEKNANLPVFIISNLENIKGYYVYFGNKLSADPVKSGKFITKNEFAPNKIMKSGTYYFIFKAKNKDGVISDSFITEYIYKAPKVIKKK